MFRKTILALAAVATLGVAAATTTTTASAAPWGGWHGGWGHHHMHRHWAPRIVVGGLGYYGGYGGCYYAKRWVGTPFGPRLRRVPVCV